MANELYQSRLTWYRNEVRTYQTYYWIVTNLSGSNPYETASAINANLFTGFGWLYDLTGIMASGGFLREFRTKRIEPGATAAFYDNPPGGAIAGRLEGQVDEYESAAWIKWHTPNDRSGRHGVRFGPVPAGMFQEADWYILFRLRVGSFAENVLTPKITSAGDPFVQAIRYKDGSAEAISAYQLAWPPGRQIQRRYRS